MNTMTTLVAISLCLLPMTTMAAPPKIVPAAPAQKTAAATLYECSKCHMRVSAAVAKKDHYKDPMDGGVLVPVKPTKK